MEVMRGYNDYCSYHPAKFVSLKRLSRQTLQTFAISPLASTTKYSSNLCLRQTAHSPLTLLISSVIKERSIPSPLCFGKDICLIVQATKPAVISEDNETRASLRVTLSASIIHSQARQPASPLQYSERLRPSQKS